MLRYLDAPRRDPTATAALRRTRRERLMATVAECLAAKRRR